MMINKSKNYFGSQALFDPYFIPPTLLYRKKEEASLFSILNDSIFDDFSLSILYQGIQGIGKKVIVNKVIKDLLIQNNKNEQTFKIININCKEKNIEELIISLLVKMLEFSNSTLNLNSLVNSKISQLWNTFKIARRKINDNLFLVFNNIEHLNPKIFKKFLLLGKEINLTIISTVNKVLRPSTLDLLNEFDIKKKLNFFTYNELYYILKQRASLAFLHDIDKELIEFMTDLIFEHYVPVPGKGIDLLRQLFPILKEQKNIHPFEMYEIWKDQFDIFQTSDEYNMFTYISEEDILTILFLDNLSNFFLNKSTYYITLKDLKELYDISCESLGYDKDVNEFGSLVKMMQGIGILSASKKGLNMKNRKSSNNDLNYDYFFMVINPNNLKIMVDAVFGKI